jgi:hypothetical protein
MAEVDAVVMELRRRLAQIRPTCADYQVAPIKDSFNWEECLLPAEPGWTDKTYYLVGFRSRRKPGADVTLLIERDTFAHEDAERHPGFLCYFKGELDDAANCVSFCLWTSREDALEAVRAPPHQAAASLTPVTYVHYILERWTLTITAQALQFTRLDSGEQVWCPQ